MLKGLHNAFRGYFLRAGSGQTHCLVAGRTLSQGMSRIFLSVSVQWVLWVCASGTGLARQVFPKEPGLNCPASASAAGSRDQAHSFLCQGLDDITISLFLFSQLQKLLFRQQGNNFGSLQNNILDYICHVF